MNKQYMVDETGIVKVITDKGNVIVKENPYNNSTGTTLYLENILENLEGKVNFLIKRTGELNNSIKHKTKIIRYINISLILSMFILLVIGIATFSKLFLILTVLSIPLSAIIKKIENIIIEKDKEKRSFYKERVQEEMCKINKINKKISTLQKERTTVNPDIINTVVEVQELENYIIDPSDYFVDAYLINNRVKQMTGSKHKVKKKTRKKNNLEYEI